MSLLAVTAQLRRSGPQGDLSLSVRCLLPARLLTVSSLAALDGVDLRGHVESYVGSSCLG